MDPIYELFKGLTLALVVVPLGAAVIVAVSGRAARRVAMNLAFLQLGLTIVLVAGTISTLSSRTPLSAEATPQFRPEFVPGALTNAADRTGWTLMSLSATPSPAGAAGPRIQFFLGVDGLNIWLVALSAVMLIPVIVVSWDAVTERRAGFYAWLFVVQAGAIGAFLSFDVILFYVFFELTLIPAFFLIGRWGTGSARRDAARKFFLYTLAGSMITLVGLVGAVLTNPVPIHPDTGVGVNDAVVHTYRPDPTAPGHFLAEFRMAARGPVTFSLPALMANAHIWAEAGRSAELTVTKAERTLEEAHQSKDPVAIRGATQLLAAARAFQPEAQRLRARIVDTQFWLFLALIAGFLVKVPVWPFHTWLPAAYSEAPLGVTIVLSSILAKLGAFGIMRLVLPLTPDAAIQYGLPGIGTLAAFGIVYGSFCAYGQRDIRLMIAYSSLAHLGFLVLGLFAFNTEGLSGAALHMVNHGISTGALFALLAFFLQRYRTTDMRQFGGLMGRFPAMAFLTLVFALASIGLPGLNNFVSEMLMLGGLIHDTDPATGATRPRAVVLAVVAVFGIFLSTWYMLTMVHRVFFNPLREPPAVGTEPPKDVFGRDAMMLGSLASLCLLLGLFPQVLLDPMKADVAALARVGESARGRVREVPLELPPAFTRNAGGPNAAKGPTGGGPPRGGKKGDGKKGDGKKAGMEPRKKG